MYYIRELTKVMLARMRLPGSSIQWCPLLAVSGYLNHNSDNIFFLDSQVEDPMVRSSRYAVYLQHWLKYFKLKQFLIIDTQDMITHPYNVTRQAETFLGLRHAVTEDHFVFDKKKGFYCFKLHPNATSMCMNGSKGRHHQELKPGLVKKLRNYFRPYNRKFYKMTGRNFGWPGS